MQKDRNLFGNTVDDIEEVSLQRSSSDQTTIDISLGHESLSVGSLHASSVLNTNGSGNISSNIVHHPLTDVGVGLLGHLGGGGESSSNGPDGFVGNCRKREDEIMRCAQL